MLKSFYSNQKFTKRFEEQKQLAIKQKIQNMSKITSKVKRLNSNLKQRFNDAVPLKITTSKFLPMLSDNASKNSTDSASIRVKSPVSKFSTKTNLFPVSTFKNYETTRRIPKIDLKLDQTIDKIKNVKQKGTSNNFRNMRNEKALMRNNLVRSPPPEDAYSRIHIIEPQTRFISPPINKKIQALQPFNMGMNINVYQENNKKKAKGGSKERYNSRNNSITSSNKSSRSNGSMMSETPMKLYRIINDISSTVSSEDDEARKLSIVSHKYSMYFNNLNSETQDESVRKLSGVSTISMNKISFVKKSGKLSTVMRNKPSIISLTNDSNLIDEVYEGESNDSSPRGNSKY